MSAMSTATGMHVTGDPEADRLLTEDPFALLLGMLLDQQVPMEWAFKGPSTLTERLGRLDPETIAAMDPDELVATFAEKPALHRYPKSMAKRAHDLSVHLLEHWDGDAGAIWSDGADGREIYRRLRALPGYGEEKSKIFLAILVKRLGLDIEGWEQAASPFSDDNPRSVADIDSPEALQAVRAWKQARKAEGKTKKDP